MMYMLRHNVVSRAVTISLAAIVCASCANHATTASSPGSGISSPPNAPVVTGAALNAPLSATQRRWVDSTLATLTLHDRVAQMVMVWMLGDYANVGDSAYAEV